MKGFTITALTEKGSEALLKDLNKNNKMFIMETIQEDPYIIKFILRVNRFTAKIFSFIKPKDFLNPINDEMSKKGAIIDEDYKVEVFEE